MSWPILRQRLQEALEPADFQLWIEPLALAEQSPGRLVLACPNAVHLAMVRDGHLAFIKALASPLLDIALTVQPTKTPASSLPDGSPRQPHLPGLAGSMPRLNARFRFERFVPGPCNQLAWAAAQALASGQRVYTNVLFLVSGTGLGKSHLAQAVAHELLASTRPERVAYLTAEDFANQMIAALRNKRMEAFKERFRRGCDVLLLEEVQFLAGKDKTQDELSYALDAVLDAGKRVIFTADRPPARIKGIKPALASRMGAGLTAPLSPPDLPTRVAILERLAQDEGVAVGREVLEYLAGELDGDVRRLQAALVGLLAQASLSRRPPGLALAGEVLAGLAQDLRRLTPAAIRDLVAAVYGLEPRTLTGKSRRQAITRPRNLALYLCRRHTAASYAELGRAFNRDHSTVMYGVDQVERGLAAQPRLAQELAFLEQRLGV
ncbi:MAG: chromosomal replication initiator protein DnaA [Pseudomonadota bacterium]